MQAVFHVNTHELDMGFLTMLKEHFTGAKLDIVVHEKDETDYLNASQANRRHLEQAMHEIESGQVVTKTYDEISIPKETP
jgi:hypothetical protein